MIAKPWVLDDINISLCFAFILCFGCILSSLFDIVTSAGTLGLFLKALFMRWTRTRSPVESTWTCWSKLSPVFSPPSMLPMWRCTRWNSASLCVVWEMILSWYCYDVFLNWFATGTSCTRNNTHFVIKYVTSSLNWITRVGPWSHLSAYWRSTCNLIQRICHRGACCQLIYQGVPMMLIWIALGTLCMCTLSGAMPDLSEAVRGLCTTFCIVRCIDPCIQHATLKQ